MYENVYLVFGRKSVEVQQAMLVAQFHYKHNVI